MSTSVPDAVTDLAGTFRASHSTIVCAIAGSLSECGCAAFAALLICCKLVPHKFCDSYKLWFCFYVALCLEC